MGISATKKPDGGDRLSATTAVSLAAMKKGVGLALADLYSLATGSAKRRIREWQTDRAIGRLYERMRAVRFVKTIWQVEKAIDLTKFYCAPRFAIDGNRTLISDHEELGKDGNILVQGSAGQGKSIFLRYQAIREFQKGLRIPLFVELRHIEQGKSLQDKLLLELDALGLRADEAILHFLLDNKKAILLLDGFDEVPEAQRSSLAGELEYLTRKFALRTILSSRPGTGAAELAAFSVFGLCTLEGREYEEIVRRACETAIAQAILKGVRASEQNIGQLLTTPLMVALLVFKYRADQSIPENIIAFYDNLFPLLLTRHDRTKAGYLRPRQSGLADSELQSCFNALSFTATRRSQSGFKKTELLEMAKGSLAKTGVQAKPDAFVDDICQITSLIIVDGDQYEFLHKSVQEYHAACFVRAQPDQFAEKFYSAVRANWSWHEVLTFLEFIDEYRFSKYVLAPELRSRLCLDDDQLTPTVWRTNKVHVTKLASETQLTITRSDSSKGFSGMSWKNCGYFFSTTPLPLFMDIPSYMKVLDFGKRVWELVANGTFSARTDPDTGEAEIPLSDILNSDSILEECIATFDSCFQAWHRHLLEAEAVLKRVESIALDFDHT